MDPDQARPPATPGSARSLTSREQVVALVAALVAVLVTLGAVALLGGGDEEGASRPPAAEEQGEEEEVGQPVGPGTEREAEADPAGDPLSWAPPELDEPTEVEVDADGDSLRLDDDRDYVVRMPDEPVRGSLSIDGGRNIHLIGGEIAMEDDDVQALKLQDWTGTLHVEGLVIDPGGRSGHENDAIRVVSEHPESTVVFQNVWVDTVAGTQESSHGDIIQTWGGPARFRIDRFTGFTEYQGFFLALEQFDWAPESLEITLRDIDLHGLAPGPASLYDPNNHTEGSGSASIATPVVENLWGRIEGPKAGEFPRFVIGGSLLRARTTDGVREGWADGGPEGSHFVDRDSVGIGYRTPGYRS